MRGYYSLSRSGCVDKLSRASPTLYWSSIYKHIFAICATSITTPFRQHLKRGSLRVSRFREDRSFTSSSNQFPKHVGKLSADAFKLNISQIRLFVALTCSHVVTSSYFRPSSALPTSLIMSFDGPLVPSLHRPVSNYVRCPISMTTTYERLICPRQLLRHSVAQLIWFRLPRTFEEGQATDGVSLGLITRRVHQMTSRISTSVASPTGTTNTTDGSSRIATFIAGGGRRNTPNNQRSTGGGRTRYRRFNGRIIRRHTGTTNGNNIHGDDGS